MDRAGALVRWSVGLGLVAGLAAGCSAANESAVAPGPSRSSAAASTTTAATAPRPATTAVVCNGTGEVNEDDDGAVAALLRPPQLPPGDWAVAKIPPCPWALSADELLVVPECLAAAEAANAGANSEARNGNARVTFARAGGIQLDDRLEIYTSRQNVDSVRAILSGPSTAACFEAALRQRGAAEPGSRVDDIHVSRFAVQPDVAALGLGFPASDGYAADAGFADGVEITYTRTTDGSSQPAAMRVITFGSGGFVSTITLTGATLGELDAIDLTDTLRGAAGNFRGMFSSTG